MGSMNIGASSLLSFCKSRKNNSTCFSNSSCTLNLHSPSTLVRLSNSFSDEGIGENYSRNTVDANMSVLRDRMEQLRMEEKNLECQNLQLGWNYNDENREVWRRQNQWQRQRQLVFMSIQLMSIFGSTIGLVFLTGSLCICTVKFIFHISSIFQ